MDAVNKDAGTAGPAAENSAGTKVINLALQGGGTHGAFTWGVLDRLLEDERIEFEGISATSAGAVNAVVMADGLVRGGRLGAREALKNFWRKLSDSASHGFFQPSFLDRIDPQRGFDHSPAFMFAESLTLYLSPYQLNPFNYNPMKNLLNDNVDFDGVRQRSNLKLFICATDVRTSKVKVFDRESLHIDHVLASTCLPLVTQAVEIDGEFYWDGGYAGNPAIFPLVYQCDSRDILMVHITPAERTNVPKTSFAIMNRMQEISFNTALIREMRAVALVNKRIEEGKIIDGKVVLVHVIEAEDLVRQFTASSRLNSDWDFLIELFNSGRDRADAWLKANFERVGVESSVDLFTKYF